jgi:hypothetical protein
LWRVFVEVEGHRDGSQLRPINCASLWLRFNFDVGGGLCLWVYMNLSGLHDARNGLGGIFSGHCVGLSMLR